MDLEQAKELGRQYMELGPNQEETKTLCVMSDGGIFINNDVDKMREHASTQKLEIFVLKGDKVEAEEKTTTDEVVNLSKKKKAELVAMAMKIEGADEDELNDKTKAEIIEYIEAN